jgi:nucleoside-diphosphate-sugar epimerase
MELHSKSILITGASGFTGKVLTKKLEALGATVFKTARYPAEDGHLGLDICSLESIEACIKESKPDIIIHLAAISFVGHGIASEFYSVNTIGTENLLLVASRILGPDTTVLVSSSANVYGLQKRDVISETTPVSPINHYACSKYSMEQMTMAQVQQA